MSHNLFKFAFLNQKRRNQYYLLHVSPPGFENGVIVLGLLFPPRSSSHYSSRQLRRLVKTKLKNTGCEQLVKCELSLDGSGDDVSYLTDTALNSTELHLIRVRKLLLFFQSFLSQGNLLNMVLQNLVTLLISLLNKERGDPRVRTCFRQESVARI